jgi:hypothetical protein
MFEKIPNPLPGGNTHMITGRNPKNRIQSVFYLGNCERCPTILSCMVL